MKRYVHIFLLHFQDALEARSRIFVWFLLALLNPVIAMLFWYGALRENTTVLSGWNFSTIASYYFLLIVGNALLHVHIDEEVAKEDVQEGRLSVFLMRPVSYLYIKLCTELPYRLIEGTLGISSLIVFALLFGRSFIDTGIETLVPAVVITILAFAVSFLFKMIVGISALWVTDVRGLQEVVFVIVLIFAGSVMPLALFPQTLANISYVLPFAYMVYFPILAFQGKIGTAEALRVIVMQLAWVTLLAVAYRKLWREGVKLFSGEGL